MNKPAETLSEGQVYTPDHMQIWLDQLAVTAQQMADDYKRTRALVSSQVAPPPIRNDGLIVISWGDLCMLRAAAVCLLEHSDYAGPRSRKEMEQVLRSTNLFERRT